MLVNTLLKEKIQWITIIPFIVMIVSSCSQIKSVEGMNLDDQKIDVPGLQSYQETVIDSNYVQYEIEIEDGINNGNSQNLSRSYVPGFEINRSVKIENTGTTIIENPRIAINGKQNWFNIDEMLEQIIDSTMSDKEKAFAIWNFVIENSYNANPAEEQDEIHDPVKFFNIYGYGVCDDLAKNLIVLWNAAGLDARLVALNGHVVSEVFYEDSYHVMDAYMEVFYLSNDNQTLASSTQLQDDNYLVKQTHHFGPYVKGNTSENLIYASLYGPDDFILPFDYQESHDMGFSLRPGESFEWRWDNAGKYHDNNTENIEKEAPPYFSNGKLIYTPDIENNLFREFLVKEKNISTKMDDGEQPKLHLENPEEDGYIVLHFESPYVIVGGDIHGSFRRRSDDDVIKMYISPDNINWQRLWMATDQKGNFEQDISLDDWVAPLSTKAKYEYYIMVEFIGASSRSDVGANSITFETDVQMATVSLPALKPGTNEIIYEDYTQGAHQVKVTHQWFNNSYNHNPEAPSSASISPQDGEEIHQRNIVFYWEKAVDEDGDEIQGYQFFLSQRPDMMYPLSTNFNLLVDKNEYEVPYDGLLSNNTRYYWRVRSLDDFGLWSDWSEVWSFVYHGPGAPVNLQFINAYTLQWQNDENGTTPVLFEVYGSNESGFIPSIDEYSGLTTIGADRELVTLSGNLITSVTGTSLQVIDEKPYSDHQNKYYYRVIAVDQHGVKSAPAYIASPGQWIYTTPVETAYTGKEYRYQMGAIHSIGTLQFGINQSLPEENEVLSYTLVSGPDWLTLDEKTGLLSGTPVQPHAAVEVAVEVSNMVNGEISRQVFNLTCLDG